jgi:hypothetical protein
VAEAVRQALAAPHAPFASAWADLASPRIASHSDLSGDGVQCIIASRHDAARQTTEG